MLQSLAGGSMFGEVWGPAPPRVVALHGWQRTHGDFSGVLGPSAAAGPLPTVAPDLAGFGATPAPPNAWGSGDYAAALADLMVSSDGPSGPAVVVGHSLGGRIAATLAATRPELVRALVLTGAPLAPRGGSTPRPPMAFRTVKLLHRLHMVTDDRVERARQRYGSQDYRVARGVMRDVLVRVVNESYDEVLAAVHCPVELVWGDGDSEVPLSVARRIAERLVTARLTVCPGAGHLLPLERPAELRAAVDRAMAAQTVRGPGPNSDDAHAAGPES